MKNQIQLKPVLDFLRDLKNNNNRAWFEKNRARYEFARAQVEALVVQLIDELRAFEDLGPLEPKDCIMRIYRDVRFAKDKSPYKTNFGIEIARGGRKSQQLGYYLHLAPKNESFVASGLYMPESDQLLKFRRAIARDAKEFKKIVAAKNFVRYFKSVEGEKLTTAPQGFPRDHPEIELLKLKQILAHHHFSDARVIAPNFVPEVVTACRALKPFVDYLNRVLK